jgi:hypothetical protein
MPTDSTPLPATKVILGCSKCGAALPDEAQFCLKCGKPVSMPAEDPVVEKKSTRQPALPKPERHYVRWILFALVLAALVWAATSDNPFAQAAQEFAGWKHDQSVLDSSFSVAAHNFRYYKFSLPEGSMNVAILGQFAVLPDKANVTKSKDSADQDAANIEVYVLSEPAFAVWQNGYATSSVFESGKSSQGPVQAELPPGAGIYYLIFNNKFSPKTTKNVQATVLLRYKSWLPDWFRRMKGRFTNWLGL